MGAVTRDDAESTDPKAASPADINALQSIIKVKRHLLWGAVFLLLPPLLKHSMGMVFQSFNLFGHRTVIENIMMAPMDLLGKSKQEA